MQMRFDGTFGFPGGLVDKGEDILEGLNRELMEEIGWDPSAHPVTWSDYFSTQVRVTVLKLHHCYLGRDQITALTTNKF